MIAVIVSGYDGDGDGAAALCGIKEVGGVTIAQKLSTAVQPDMPASAIASGCVGFILAPEEIADAIVRIARAERTPDGAERARRASGARHGSRQANTVDIGVADDYFQ